MRSPAGGVHRATTSSATLAMRSSANDLTTADAPAKTWRTFWKWGGPPRDAHERFDPSRPRLASTSALLRSSVFRAAAEEKYGKELIAIARKAGGLYEIWCVRACFYICSRNGRDIPELQKHANKAPCVVLTAPWKHPLMKWKHVSRTFVSCLKTTTMLLCSA